MNRRPPNLSSPSPHLRGVSSQFNLPNLIKKYLLLIAVSISLIFFVYPSAFIYSKQTLPDSNDTRLLAYIIGQVQKNLTEQNPLYFGTYFAPDKNTLAYSDLFLTSSVLTLPLRPFTDSPIFVFNFALILGFLLTCITSFLLFEYLFKDIWVTILATVLFNFSGFHLSYLPHLHTFSLWLMLASIYFFLRFRNENKIVLLHLFFITLTMQLAESIFPAYLTFFTCAFIFFFGGKNHPDYKSILKDIKQIFKTTLIYLPVWILLLFPYLKLQLTFPEATRPIRDAAHFSLGLEEIVTKYHSLTLLILLPLSILLNKNFKKNLNLLSWKIILLFSTMMSLGPVLKIFGSNLRPLGLLIPLPYTLFYYLFPGFTGFRTPSRFIILALLAATILVGYNLQSVFAKLKVKTKLIFILLILSFLFVEADLPLKGYPVNINMHPVYQEVKSLPETAVILELPIKLWNMPDHEIESVRSLYTLSHNHRRLGGFSGFATNDWVDLVEKINAYGLNSENIEKLRLLGVTHIIENNTLKPIL